jgi:hypothetical protein
VVEVEEVVRPGYIKRQVAGWVVVLGRALSPEAAVADGATEESDRGSELLAAVNS